MQNKLFASVVFVVGCIAGGAASQIVVPSVRAGTSPTKWEYLCGPVSTTPLNAAGLQGWELVNAFVDNPRGIETVNFCFKRALP